MTWGNDPCTARLLATMSAEAERFEKVAENDFKRALEAFRNGDDVSASSHRRIGEYMQAVAGNNRAWVDMIRSRITAAAAILAGGGK